MTFRGLLLQESLADASVLERLKVTKVETWEPGEMISHAMHDSFWYANIHLDVLSNLTTVTR